MENISSEEQLLQLRNEGKINEAEYKELHDAMSARSANKNNTDTKTTHQPEFHTFQKWVLIGGMIICWIGLPIGFVLKLPLVWVLCIFGIVAIGIKMHIIRR